MIQATTPRRKYEDLQVYLNISMNLSIMYIQLKTQIHNHLDLPNLRTQYHPHPKTTTFYIFLSYIHFYNFILIFNILIYSSRVHLQHENI
jgi:hypothetical protein